MVLDNLNVFADQLAYRFPFVELFLVAEGNGAA
jgi:hypothetical protein